MPKAGKPPATRWRAATAEVAGNHHPQVVSRELHNMVVVPDGRVFFENVGFMRRLNIFLNRHQALFSGFLQNIEQQRHQLHVAGFGVFASLKAGTQPFHGGFDDLHLVVRQKSAQRCTANSEHFPWQRLQDDSHVSAVDDEYAKDASQDH